MQKTESSPDLTRFTAELAALRMLSAETLDGLTEAQLGWSPAKGVWSAGEVLIHLSTTNELYVDAIRKAVQESQARGRLDAAPHRPSLMGGFLTRSMASPRKVPAPRAFRPDQAATVAADWNREVARYRATQGALESALREAAGVSLNATRVASPVTRLVRMNLGDAFALWLVHDRRHMGQIQRLCDRPEFPA